MSNNIDRPKIGLALSGGAGKAIAHIGILEEFTAAGIPIDYICACSSAAIVAGSFASGTMPRLKADWLTLNRGFLFKLIQFDRNGKGVFSLDKAVAWAKTYLGEQNLEDMRPRLGFTCVDVLTGEPVLLSMGSILRAGQACCSVPGLIEPVRWGNKLLVDGGLYNLVPTTQAKEMGADIVIAVEIASARFMFTRKTYRLRDGYNFVRGSLPVRLYLAAHNFLDRIFTRSLDYIFYSQADLLEESHLDEPGMLGVLGRAIDISNRQRRKFQGHIPDCDLLITPKVKHIGKIDLASAADMLAEGRRAARAALPEIRKKISEWELKHSHA